MSLCRTNLYTGYNKDILASRILNSNLAIYILVMVSYTDNL